MDEIILGRPARPRRPKKPRPLKVAAVKPPRPKTTKRNRYSSAPPVSSNPLAGNPWVWGKPGNIYPGGKVPRSAPAPAASGPGAAGAPAAPAGTAVSGNPLPGMNPYYGLPDWAQNQLRQIDADEKAHLAYASGTVAPWLAQALTNLTGVDPNQPGLNTSLQQQYLANVQGAVGGAFGAAAAATPMNPAATTPGGIVASPTAYLSNAAREGAVGRSSGALQAAQVQSALNTMQPNTQSQGYVYALADYMKGLPAVYSQRRAEARSSIDQYIAEQQQAQAELAFNQAKFAEDMRHNRVTEATSAWNAQTNSAIALGNLGLKADDQAFGQAQDLAGAGAPAPYGYNRDPATGKLVRDPSIPQASASSGGGGGGGGTSTRDAKGRLKNPTSQGFVGGWKVKPKKLPTWAKSGFTQGADGKWYVKGTPGGGSSGSGGSTGKVKGYGSLVSDLGKKWNGSSSAFGSDTGWATTFRGNPSGIAEALAGWVVENATSFNTNNGKFDANKAMRAISTLGDGQKKWLLIWPLLKKRIKNGVLK